MNKSPFLHASLAALYIIVIVFVMNALSSITAGHDSLLTPIVILSMFVISAAIMGFLFAAEPLRLCFENHTREASAFFLKTIAIFACFAVLFVCALLSTSLL